MNGLAAGFDARDDGSHEPGEGPWWAERWFFGWGSGFVELTLLPNQRRAWYRCALVDPDRPLLAVVEHDAPLPRVGLTLRANGLWAEHVVEAPFEQWTVANETYALAVDDPDELVGRGYGEPAPLAFDLEWYASGAATRAAAGDGYEQQGEIDGVAELGGGARLTVTGPSTRRHEWGPLRLPSADDGAHVQPAAARVPDRWPSPFDVVVEDVLGDDGWRRRLA